jgi:hypothetical protein
MKASKSPQCSSSQGLAELARAREPSPLKATMKATPKGPDEQRDAAVQNRPRLVNVLGWARTTNLCLRRAALYPIELQGPVGALGPGLLRGGRILVIPARIVERLEFPLEVLDLTLEIRLPGVRGLKLPLHAIQATDGDSVSMRPTLNILSECLDLDRGALIVRHGLLKLHTEPPMVLQKPERRVDLLKEPRPFISK